MELREKWVLFYYVNYTLRANVKIDMRQFVPDFVSYVSAKHYLNCFTIGTVIAKIKGLTFLKPVVLKLHAIILSIYIRKQPSR